jgi:2-phosphosulfolactate phosphatase
MVPVADLEECRKYKDQGFLIAGERDGLHVDGFDIGNSPFSYMEPNIRGAKIAITTTNGTKAIKAAQERNAKDVVIGAFSNLSYLCDWLIARNEHVTLLCSGWRDNVNLEDTIFAGAVVRKLRNHFRRYQDTALMAETLYNSANTRKRYFFRNSSHFHRLVHLNLQPDVKYSMRRDTHPVLPVMIGDQLRDLSRYEGDFNQLKKNLLAQQEAEAKKIAARLQKKTAG